MPFPLAGSTSVVYRLPTTRLPKASQSQMSHPHRVIRVVYSTSNNNKSWEFSTYLHLEATAMRCAAGMSRLNTQDMSIYRRRRGSNAHVPSCVELAFVAFAINPISPFDRIDVEHLMTFTIVETDPSEIQSDLGARKIWFECYC